ncbi:MAG: hypothetical protein PVF43_04390 [Candidatus Eiseniibacteriota bacterium]|jgi:hypothetical protein
MHIAYLDPLRRAWQRMRWMLLSPFDATRWLVIGFTVWLAHLTDTWTWFGGKDAPDIGARIQVDAWHDVAYDVVESVRELFAHGLEIAVVVLLGILAFAVYVVLLWLGSRGVFMFLDNLVHNRAEVKQPWRAYGERGDSLFLWRIVFGVLCVIATVPLVVFGVMVLMPVILADWGAAFSVPAVILLAFVALLLGLAIAFVDFFLIHFVAPIMYLNDVKVMEAWRLFLPVLREHPGSFILYALFYFLLWVCVAACIVLAGLLTCCIGWLVLSIPVIGTTLLLPVHLTLRTFDLEFLAQFGPECDLVRGFARPQRPGDAG